MATRAWCVGPAVLAAMMMLGRAASAQGSPPGSGGAGDDANRAPADGARPIARDPGIGLSLQDIDSGALDGAIDPATYVVGPGDRMTVTLWGMKDVSDLLEVNAEGVLLVPKIGVFHAGGQTLGAVREAVNRRLRAVYPSLRGGLTLVRPRTFLVRVAGAVMRPGAYRATPLTRVSTLLSRAGGVLPAGSTRRVEVRRGSGVLRADLLRFTLFGLADVDPPLLDGDTVFVPLREMEVEIGGAVKRPGRYELVGKKTLDELIELAGGLSAELSKDLPLRLSERGAGDKLVSRSIQATAAAGAILHDGDRVYVPSLGDLRRTVIVEGAVAGVAAIATELQRATSVVDRRVDTALSAPREVSVPVPYVEGDGVRDVLSKAGGLQPWADPQSAYLLREGPHGGRQRIALDLAAISAQRAPDVEVKDGDTVVVPSRRDAILVTGAVQRPGLYQYSPELKPMDYLMLAGGATRVGDQGSARVVGRNGTAKPVRRVELVSPGDTITVPEKSVSPAEWVQISLMLGNLAVGVAAIALTTVRR